MPAYLKALLTGKYTFQKTKVPWRSFGYYGQVVPKIAQLVKNTGHLLIEEPKLWSFKDQATIFVCETAAGRFYLKICRQYSNEVRLTQKLSELFPRQVSKTIGASVELNAILTADFGKDLGELYFSSSLDQRLGAGCGDTVAVASQALCQWAAIQQESLRFIKDLTDIGVPIYDSSWFRKGLEDVIDFVEKHQLLAPDLRTRLRKFSVALDDGLRMWENSGIPKTLVHGDLHESNIAQPGGPGTNMIFFDWDSAFIGYPFLDLVEEFGCNVLLAAKDVYYERWVGFADLKGIQELILWSKPIELLRGAILDALHVSSCREDLQEKRFDISSSLEEMLSYLEANHAQIASV